MTTVLGRSRFLETQEMGRCRCLCPLLAPNRGFAPPEARLQPRQPLRWHPCRAEADGGAASLPNIDFGFQFDSQPLGHVAADLVDEL